jgi:hypothetical protein
LDFLFYVFFCNLLRFFKDSAKINIKEKKKNHQGKRPWRSSDWFLEMMEELFLVLDLREIKLTLPKLEEAKWTFSIII